MTKPVVIAEVDEVKAALKRSTVTAIDDRQPGHGDMQFSSFPLTEDRITHDLILHVTSYGQETNPKDWAAAARQSRNQSNSLSAIGWRRGSGRGGAFVWDGPSPRSSPHSVVVGRGSSRRAPASSPLAKIQGNRTAENFRYTLTIRR